MLSGNVAIRITGNKQNCKTHLYVGWIEYVNSDGSVDSRSIQNTIISEYEKNSIECK